MKDVKLIATDLDGTFLKNDRTVSDVNIEALRKLTEKGVVKVAATGRNMKKVKEVISEDLPFDFIVFSSGAGVYNWNTHELMQKKDIKANDVQNILNFLLAKNINFNVYRAVPENHRFYYFRGSEKCDEFERYLSFNMNTAEPLLLSEKPQGEMCQFLIIIKHDEQLFERLKSEIEALSNEIRVIRASSPMSDGFIWIEIFYKTVSKGNGVNLLCEHLGVSQKDTMAVGNDYNDFDLLDFTEYSFLTANSPKEIQHKYPLVPDNENDAFASVVQTLFS
jgi:Cof subfamily protein (haloacid dehalogenase superfamily)